MEEQKNYTYELVVARELFYQEDSMWGVYSFEFKEDADRMASGVELNSYGNFVISGNVFKLETGKSYPVTFKDAYTERYGDGFEFVNVSSEGLNDADSQMKFLETVLPTTLSEQIADKYGGTEEIVEKILSGDIDLTQFKGVGEKTLPKLIKKIQEFSLYSEAIVLLSPLGATLNKVQQIVAHFGGAGIVKQIIDTNIYRLTEIKGFGFKRVDEFALNLGYEKDSSFRVLAGASYVLEQMSNYGDIKISIEDFDEEMCKALEISEVTDEIFGKIIDSDLFYYSGGYISLTKLRDEEKEIAARIINLQTSAEPIEGLREALEEAIVEQEEINGFKFTETQKNAMYTSIDNGIMIINGVAGSGKTSIVKTIAEAYRKCGIKHQAVALSGKASLVLSENGLNASTIHRALQYIPKVGFVHNEDEPMPSGLIILDESSMVNNTLFNDLLKAIKAGARFIMVGDSGQLPPIGHGAVFENLLKLDLPRVELTEIHRQAAKSGIITTAGKIRNHEQINEMGTDGVEIFGELQDMRVFSYIDKTMIKDDLLRTIKQFNKNPNMDARELQVLTAMKRGELGVATLNAEIQNILNPKIAGEESPTITTKGVEFRIGDRVIQSGNMYKATKVPDIKSYELFKQGKSTIHPFEKDADGGYIHLFEETQVFNGTIGYIKDIVIDPEDQISGMLIEFDSGDKKELVYYYNTKDTKEVGMLDLAYAITTHRSQGSGFNTVLFVFDYSAYMLLSKEFAYTGLTRAKNHCLMFVETTALHHAIRTTHSSNRQTYLKEFANIMLEKVS